VSVAAAASRERKPERLIVHTAFLGDVLLGIPLVRAMKNAWPEDRLTVLVRKGVGSFFREAGVVDDVIEVEKSSGASWRAAKKELNSREFQLVVCPHALLVAGLRAKKKIGFEKFYNSFAFDVRIPRPLHLPEALRQLSLLSGEVSTIAPLIAAFEMSQVAAGGQGPRKGRLVPPAPGADMQVASLVAIREAFEAGGDWRSLSSPGARKLAEELGVGIKPLVVLAPGSVWKTKMWTTAGYVEVAKAWMARGARVAIFGAPSEAALAAEIAEASGAISIAGRTSLFESAQILALAEFLVCNDSGAMHLGSTAGTPTVGIFGPTVLEFGYRPWTDRAKIVQVDLDCRPCGKHGAKKCPIGTHACMKGISSATVLAAVDDLRREPR
jgi:heptosyltransferase II